MGSVFVGSVFVAPADVKQRRGREPGASSRGELIRGRTRRIQAEGGFGSKKASLICASRCSPTLFSSALIIAQLCLTLASAGSILAVSSSILFSPSTCSRLCRIFCMSLRYFQRLAPTPLERVRFVEFSTISDYLWPAAPERFRPLQTASERFRPLQNASERFRTLQTTPKTAQCHAQCHAHVHPTLPITLEMTCISHY